MFGIDSGEVLIIAIVALVVIGPKDLPRVMRTIGNFVGRARGMARHFRSGIDTMMRESELEEMEKKWKADNERIMREHPLTPTPAGDSDWGKKVPEAAAPVSAPATSGQPEAPAKPRPVPAVRALSGTAPPIPPSGATPPAPGERP
ncbi:MAG: Sec-independent protein translocase protein TatB [Allosphingosinicella sp.]